MANTNGLITSKDVCGTGAVNSNFYLRKGAPIVSPLIIVSPDGTKQGGITEDNSGSMVLATDGDLSLSAGSGRLFIQSPNTLVSTQMTQENGGPFVIVTQTGPVEISSDGGLIVAPSSAGAAGQLTLRNSTASATPVRYTTFVASVTGGDLTEDNLQTFGFPGALTRSIVNHAPDGSQTIVGDGAVVGGCNLSVAGRVSGGSPPITSRVFDSVFNPPPSQFVITLVASAPSGNIAFVQDLTLSAGLYQLQLSIESATSVANSSLQVFATAPPSTAVINQSGASRFTTLSQNVSDCINTGFFAFAGGNLRVAVECSVLGSFWTGSFECNIVKLG